MNKRLPAIKLWQRVISEDGSSRLLEIEKIPTDLPVIICLPGISTNHNSPRAINGFMKLAESKMGGRGINGKNVNFVSISYDYRQENNIGLFNSDPTHFFSDASRDFFEKRKSQINQTILEGKKNIMVGIVNDRVAYTDFEKAIKENNLATK
jgi:hypothetical protein